MGNNRTIAVKKQQWCFEIRRWRSARHSLCMWRL